MVFQFFNHLHQKGKQMIFAGHCSPEKLQGIDDRLISRFAWGLSVEIKPPITETKMAILSGIAEKKGLTLNSEILSYLAENGPSNIRELEGIVIRLLFQKSISKEPITIELTKEIIAKPSSSTDGNFHIADILHYTLLHFNVDKELLMSKSRSKEVALCRQVGMYIAKTNTSHSLKSVGIEFGRDHSTVSHALKTIEKQRATDSVLNNDIESIIKKLSEI
jgi:chromosomal replication initiator protein